MEKHNKGTVSSTKNRRPFRLITFEEYENYDTARKREKEIKSYKSGNSFTRLILKNR